MKLRTYLLTSLVFDDEDGAGKEAKKKAKPKKSKYKKSVFFRFIALIVFLSVIVMVIDPMTTNVNEGEIIFRAVFYPYFKVKAHFEDDVADFDRDGIPDYDEIHGWEMPSDVIILKKKGDITRYRLTTGRSGDYALSFRYFSGTGAQFTFSLNSSSNNTVKSQTLNSTGIDYEEELIFEKLELLGKETMEFSLQLEENATVKIDWIKFQKIGEFFGTVLDADDYTATFSADPVSPITISTDTINYRTDWKNPDSDFDGMLDGYELATGRLNGGWSDPMVTNTRYAVLIGGGDIEQESNYLAFSNAVITVYEAIHNSYGYLDKNIHVLFWDGEPLAIDIVDDDGSLNSIYSTFEHLSLKSTKNDLLFVYLTSHGTYDENQNLGRVQVYLKPGDVVAKNYTLSYDILAAKMSNVTAAEKVLIIEACNSGSAALSFDIGDDVQIFTSSTKEDVTFTYPNGNPPFTHHFMQALTNPILGSIPTLTEIKSLDIKLEESEFISVGLAYEKSRGKLGLALNGSPLEAWSTQQPQQNDVAELKGNEVYL